MRTKRHRSPDASRPLAVALIVAFLIALVLSLIINTAHAAQTVYKQATAQGLKLVTAYEWRNCMVPLISRENGNVPARWNVHATNPSSGAYGLPQALPGSKMVSAGPRWRDDAATQIRWMVGYVRARYGGPCQADAFQRRNNWY